MREREREEGREGRREWVREEGRGGGGERERESEIGEVRRCGCEGRSLTAHCIGCNDL